MAEGLNRVMLLGNLGQTPELRYTQSGQAVLSLRLATNESWVDKNGERQERTEWHTVVVWGKRGEGLNKVIGKGSQLFVEGRLQTRPWEDRQGQKRYTTEVVANNVVLLGRGRGGGADDRPPPPDERGPEGPDSGGGGYDEGYSGGGGGGGSAGGGGGGGGGRGGGFSDDDIPF